MPITRNAVTPNRHIRSELFPCATAASAISFLHRRRQTRWCSPEARCASNIFLGGTTMTATSVLAQATYNPSSSYPTTSTSCIPIFYHLSDDDAEPHARHPIQCHL
ncbi:hypothetical protein C8J57DRAFT_1514498 [Mycena rebaudengoi]|nr:hypothetical protein C8J57DRAFT_1514498 [Mycena rebaudengoi]